MERQFAVAKNSTSQSAFGIQKVRTVKVMNPDFGVQNQFADFVHQVNKSKIVYQTTLNKLTIFTKSLL
mgnify:CR=1 FL=1